MAEREVEDVNYGQGNWNGNNRGNRNNFQNNNFRGNGNFVPRYRDVDRSRLSYGNNFYEGAPQGNNQQQPQQQAVQQPLVNTGPSEITKAGNEACTSLADLGKKMSWLIATVGKNHEITCQRLTELENDRKETTKRMQEILEKHSMREQGKLPGNSGQAMAVTIIT